ncbi:MAG: hypothetical protein KBC12_02675 [Candidatus Pacebacteria bacterium]|nr:hypothetical protein [Candidatus Paceibacterota bacterium]MBP9851344.1 hypothetical protein [Candidatus Paceibacterota bacterium]
MNNETKNCQNCKTDFIIEPEDFSFYEKIKVPPPTFCPECRLQRRMAFRNERTLYKAVCDLCTKNVVTIFDPEIHKTIYCGSCWWGDSWDGTEYAMEYDSSRNFFDQLKDLMLKTPKMNLVVTYSTLKNSDYINHAGGCKNCYLLFNADFCENVYYSTIVNHSKDVADCLMMNKTEFAYECIGGDGSRIFFSENCAESVDVWYSKDCVSCTNCFGCVNLRNKSYHIFNQAYSKEEYLEKIKSMNLDKYSYHKLIQSSIHDFWNKFPRRFMYGRMNVNVTGEYVYASKNVKNSYMTASADDAKYCQFITLPSFKDSYDISEWGSGVESCVDSITAGEGIYQVKYSSGVWSNVKNVEYSMYVINSSDCFGCVGLRNKQYCILNKQYSKEEYQKLREQIINSLEANPYVDSQGRIFKYGEFMPYDLSPFSYNASYAIQYFPMTKEEIQNKGFIFSEIKSGEHNITKNTADLPDSISDITDAVTKEVLACTLCTKPYRIALGELELLKRLSLPVPRSCPNCRHNRRIDRVNKWRLFERNCGKCQISIQTSYAPERPEIVYCEKCYQQEVY